MIILGETIDVATAGVVPCQFKVGDKVRVDLEVEILKDMQEGHGGWNPRMQEVRSLSSIWFKTIPYFVLGQIFSKEESSMKFSDHGIRSIFFFFAM